MIIGRNWLGATAQERPQGNRLHDPRDYVRVEIEAALKRDIPIIPVLVQGGAIPDEEALPPTLHGLQFRNGISVRPDPDFDQDMHRLMASLDQLLSQD